MPSETANSLHIRIAATLPEIPAECPDPQCGDSTWDHACRLGGSVPNDKLTDLVVVEVRKWLRAEAATWRQQARIVEQLEPSSAAVFSMRLGADCFTVLASTLGTDVEPPDA